jgi:hypothetical protein
MNIFQFYVVDGRNHSFFLYVFFFFFFSFENCCICFYADDSKAVKHGEWELDEIGVSKEKKLNTLLFDFGENQKTVKFPTGITYIYKYIVTIFL